MQLRPYGLNNYQRQTEYWRRMEQERSMALKGALDLLRPEMAAVLKLHYWEHKPFKDITSLISKSMSTVRHHHSRGIFLVFHFLEYQEIPRTVVSKP
jgi:DNA-directed RNA polymerase specialized sigma24 family protein